MEARKTAFRVSVPHKPRPPSGERGCAYLIGPAPTTEQLFARILHHEGFKAVQASVSLSVTRLAKAAPSFVLLDFVDLDIDQLEALRQVRFVLPRSVIAVYSEQSSIAWAFECHLAGANCLLAKKSTHDSGAAGIHEALEGGCYTDPNFATRARK